MRELVKIRPEVNGLIPRLRNYQQCDREGVVVEKYDNGAAEVWAVRFMGYRGLSDNIDYFPPSQLVRIMEMNNANS